MLDKKDLSLIMLLLLSLVCLLSNVAHAQQTSLMAYCPTCKPPKIYDIPAASTNWVELVSAVSTKWSPRNSHATCVFKQKIWLAGGKVDSYTMYKLQANDKKADVWHSDDGATWDQVTNLKGDFWAQNDDALQPGPVAPWYERHGHSLDAVDVTGDGESDLMVLLGGYAPEPSNDMWVSVDGIWWIFAGYAPWSPRAWHATTTFNNTLYLTGGSPLNSEVWRLDSVTYIANRTAPLTRSISANHTYHLHWTRLTEAADWSPRVGMGLVSHWWFNDTAGETIDDSKEYLVLVGGFGGVTNTSSPDYDGMHGRNDVWISTDGRDWTCATPAAAFDGRGWMGLAELHAADPRLSTLGQAQGQSGEIYLMGGGDIGFSTSSTSKITSVDGKVDAYWSRDMVNWNKINYQEGGGRPSEIQRLYSSKDLPQYSSQEWAKTVVDTVQVYLGLWGMTVETFNPKTGKSVGAEHFFDYGSLLIYVRLLCTES
jgi:hypothetical protein